MKVKSTLSGLLLVCMLLASVQSITYYNATFDTYVGHQAIYDMGYLSNDTTVIVNISNTASGTGATNVSALKVVLMNPNLATSNTTINSTASSLVKCDATTKDTKVASYSCQILSNNVDNGNQRYHLRIGYDPSPTNGGNLQYFQVVVNSFYNQTNITNGTTDGSSKARTLFKGT